MADGLNLSTRQGEGAANIINWGNTDRAVAQLAADQKQREAMGYRDYQATQAQLQKEFANVRSADIPDVMKAYGDYKTQRQAMLFDNKIKNNPIEYAKAQQAAGESLSKLYSLIGASHEQKDFHHSLSQELLQHRDDYADNAQQVLSGDLQKPTAQLVAEGKNTVNPYLYPGSNTDFGGYVKGAIGEKNQVTPTPTQTTETELIDNAYKHGNTPAQVASTLSQNFAKHALGRDAAWSYRNLPDDEKQRVQNAYDSLGQDFWDKWGQKKESQHLDQNSGVSDAQKYATYLAQKSALENVPQLGEPKRTANPTYVQGQLNKRQEDAQRHAEEMEGMKQKYRVALEGMKQGNRKALAAFKHNFKKLDTKDQGEFLDNYMSSLEEDAKKNPKDYTANGVTTKQYDIKASPDVKELFGFKGAGGHLIYPDRVRLLENGNIQPIFFKYTTNADGADVKVIGKNGQGVVDEEKSVPMLRSEFKARIGKQLLGQKEANSEISDDEENDNDTDDIPDFLKK